MAQSNFELCKQGFYAVNKYKRHRTLRESSNTEADRNFHELQMFKTFDSIELTLRAIQSNDRFNSKPTTTSTPAVVDEDEVEDDVESEEEGE